jgi:hypothetical protein
MAALFSRIIPILFVSDLRAERDFYVRLGFYVTYQGPEYPYFLALGHGRIEFGIEWRQGFSPAAPDRVRHRGGEKAAGRGRGGLPGGADEAERGLAVPGLARAHPERLPPAARRGQRIGLAAGRRASAERREATE